MIIVSSVLVMPCLFSDILNLMSKSAKFLLLIFSIIFLNLIALWTIYLIDKNPQETSVSHWEYEALKQELKILQKQQPNSPVNASQSAELEFLALKLKLEQLEASLAAINKKTQLDTKQSKKIQISETSNIKEHFVYLGTGSTTSREWTNIDATAAIIDTANYQNVTAVYFEAASSIIGGEVHARLLNKTTGGIFNESEIANNSSSTIWKTSTKIALDHGRNEYLVQIKSTSGERANLDGARIRILVE